MSAFVDSWNPSRYTTARVSRDLPLFAWLVENAWTIVSILLHINMHRGRVRLGARLLIAHSIPILAISAGLKPVRDSVSDAASKIGSRLRPILEH